MTVPVDVTQPVIDWLVAEEWIEAAQAQDAVAIAVALCDLVECVAGGRLLRRDAFRLAQSTDATQH